MISHCAQVLQSHTRQLVGKIGSQCFYRHMSTKRRFRGRRPPKAKPKSGTTTGTATEPALADTTRTRTAVSFSSFTQRISIYVNALLTARFRHGQDRYVFHRGHVYAFAQRMLLVASVLAGSTALSVALQEEEDHRTGSASSWFPFMIQRIRGPSMLPTMAADESDVWLVWTEWEWWRKHCSFLAREWQRGDVVGFASSSEATSSSLDDDDKDKDGKTRTTHSKKRSSISCKRIIGLPGDCVQRYGQYVHLYVDQDPEGLGITWPDGAVVDPTSTGKQMKNPKETLVLPDGHVWLEADCPGVGIDSRQLGPIAMDQIRGRVVAQLWPLKRKPWQTRPHPIPLDPETLLEHNVYYRAAAAAAAAAPRSE